MKGERGTNAHVHAGRPVGQRIPSYTHCRILDSVQSGDRERSIAAFSPILIRMNLYVVR